MSLQPYTARQCIHAGCIWRTRVKPSLFGYARAESVEDALSLLAQGDGEPRVLAGGQSLVPLLNLRMARVNALIDVNGLSELSFITREDGMLRVGALTR